MQWASQQELHKVTRRVATGVGRHTFPVVSLDTSVQLLKNHERKQVLYHCPKFSVYKIPGNHLVNDHTPKNCRDLQTQDDLPLFSWIRCRPRTVFTGNHGAFSVPAYTYSFYDSRLSEIRIDLAPEGSTRMDIAGSNNVTPQGWERQLMPTPGLAVLHKQLLASLAGDDPTIVSTEVLAEHIFSAALCCPAYNTVATRKSITDGHLQVLNRAKSFILENFEKNILLHDIARYALMSPYYLSRVFGERFNHAPYTYLLKVRLKHSELLLHNWGLSIAEVSLRSGFNSPNYFATAFLREYKTTPTRFRTRVSTQPR